MCETPGMKRSPALRDLSDDHHTALVVAQRCKRATPASYQAIWSEVRAGLDGHFAPHFALEEEHLVPALRRLSRESLADRILEEHVALRKALDKPQASLEEVQSFGSLLERHVRFEEREVFDPLQDELPGPALAGLASASRALPRSFDLGLLNSLR